MNLWTLCRFYWGDANAIRTIAQSPRALWVGALFVLSAGCAREYDGEDLQHEPWYLLIPFAASMAASLVLFAIFYFGVCRGDKERPSFLSAYRGFLTLFWMTAPLAWLYAIPYERFLDPLSAIKANLLTLAVVALWRVALVARVLSVLTGYNLLKSFNLVALVADLILLISLVGLPSPVPPIHEEMAGIRFPETEVFMRRLSASLAIWGVVALVVLLLLWLVLVTVLDSRKEVVWVRSAQEVRPRQGIWMGAGLSVLVWAFILPWTQPEQQLRHRVESAFKHRQIGEAVSEMSAHEPADFPPNWEPPPLVRFEELAFLLDILEEIVSRPTAAWIRDRYVSKLDRFIDGHYGLELFSPADRSRLVQLLRLLTPDSEHGSH